MSNADTSSKSTLTQKAATYNQDTSESLASGNANGNAKSQTYLRDTCESLASISTSGNAKSQIILSVQASINATSTKSAIQATKQNLMQDTDQIPTSSRLNKIAPSSTSNLPSIQDRNVTLKNVDPTSSKLATKAINPVAINSGLTQNANSISTSSRSNKQVSQSILMQDTEVNITPKSSGTLVQDRNVSSKSVLQQDVLANASPNLNNQEINTLKDTQQQPHPTMSSNLINQAAQTPKIQPISLQRLVSDTMTQDLSATFLQTERNSEDRQILPNNTYRSTSTWKESHRESQPESDRSGMSGMKKTYTELRLEVHGSSQSSLRGPDDKARAKLNPLKRSEQKYFGEQLSYTQTTYLQQALQSASQGTTNQTSTSSIAASSNPKVPINVNLKTINKSNSLDGSKLKENIPSRLITPNQIPLNVDPKSQSDLATNYAQKHNDASSTYKESSTSNDRKSPLKTKSLDSTTGNTNKLKKPLNNNLHIQ
jgi:hypothetical protein